MPNVRFDYAELKTRRTDEGFLIDSPKVARTGILEYRQPDGSIRRELRLPEDVFHKDSLSSFVGKPVTVDHPKGAISSKDIWKHQIGTILSEGRADGENVVADIVVHQPEKIGERRQLSVGYSVDLEETPGEWNGQRYDAIQRNIKVNHLSIVKSARAGAQARLNLDSNEEPLSTEQVNMPKIRLDTGIEYEAAPEVVAEVERLRADSAARATEVKTHQTTIATLTGERDTLKARVDGIPAEVAAAEAKAKTALAERAKLETTAATFKVDTKDKTDDEIKHAVIKTFNKDFDPKDKSADYVQACYDVAVQQTRTDANASQRKAVNGKGEGGEQRNDGAQEDPRTSYKKSLGANGIKKD